MVGSRRAFKYEYYVNGKWVEERPGCHDNKQFNQTYIR